MDPHRLMRTLSDACRELEAAGEYAAAAFVGHAMDVLSERHRIPLPPGAPPCGRAE